MKMICGLDLVGGFLLKSQKSEFPKDLRGEAFFPLYSQRYGAFIGAITLSAGPGQLPGGTLGSHSTLLYYTDQKSVPINSVMVGELVFHFFEKGRAILCNLLENLNAWPKVIKPCIGCLPCSSV